MNIGAVRVGGVVRDEPTEDRKPAEVPTHFPMRGDATLARVAQGTATLARGAKGASVQKLQQALELAGARLPRYGADGQWGAESTAALTRFQLEHQLPATGELDARTLAALDREAPKGLRTPEYAQLYADGVLHSTLAVGYDETGAQVAEVRKVLDGLAARGYRRLDVSRLSPEQRERLGVTSGDATWFTRTFDWQGRSVTAVVRLITPDTPQAQAQFSDAMRRDELVLYGGHGRYGSGPDFDDIHSPAGNYVIGAPFEPGHVTLGERSLKAASLGPQYQLLFFDGCNTFRYFDDLRAVPKNKTTKNLDVVGSTTELYWNVTADNLLTLLDGVVRGDSIDEVRARLDAQNRTGPEDLRRLFATDGFDDNR